MQRCQPHMLECSVDRFHGLVLEAGGCSCRVENKACQMPHARPFSRALASPATSSCGGAANSSSRWKVVELEQQRPLPGRSQEDCSQFAARFDSRKGRWSRYRPPPALILTASDSNRRNTYNAGCCRAAVSMSSHTFVPATEMLDNLGARDGSGGLRSEGFTEDAVSRRRASGRPSDGVGQLPGKRPARCSRACGQN